jgi:ATP-dependent DNA helicase RecG
MTIDELEALLQVRSENEHVEFKEAKNHFHFEKLVDYCVAMANECGGRIVLGVTDKIPRQVVGTTAFDIPEKTCGGLFERIHLKVLFEEIAHPKGRVLVFSVPSRPIGRAIEYKGRYSMRAGEELVGMSPDQLKAIFDEGQPNFVDLTAKDSCSEEEVVTLLDTASYFDLRERPYPSSRSEVLATFSKKGFIAKSEGGYRITNLGALLFAKNIADFPDLSRKAVRVIVYDGTTKSKVKGGKDITARRGYASGFNDLIDYIYDQLPASEEIRTALRTTTYAYPKKAIRELVGNAIVHQDLTETGTGITVEVFDERVEVTNPGLPILPVDRFIDENQSRNERFAATLRALRVCDERGHGIDEVVRNIEVFQLPPYFCRLGSRHTTVILSRYKQLRELTPDERNQAVYQHCCLRYVNNKITNNESIRERFGIEKQNSAQATRILNDAVAKGLIRLADPDAAHKIKRYIPYWA